MKTTITGMSSISDSITKHVFRGFVCGPKKPKKNKGPWLNSKKDQWFIFDEEKGRYIPFKNKPIKKS